MSTQVEADSQRRVTGERLTVPTALEIQPLAECVKVRTKGSCGKGKLGKLVSDSEKIFHQSVDKSDQRPGFQHLAFCKTKLKADLKRKENI